MAIAMAAPISDINIKVGDRNITLVPTAKSVRKWKHDIKATNGNFYASWLDDSNVASISPA